MKAHPQKFINISSGALQCSPKLDFPEAMRLIKSAELAFMRGLMDAVESDKDNTAEQNNKFKEDLYDAYNQACSSVLFQFAPEFEMRPDLTVEAIARAQEEILKEKTPDEAAALVFGNLEGIKCTESSKTAPDATQG